MALKLKLKPQEKVVINGAVIQNGDRMAEIVVVNRAQVLRQKDVLQEEEANTPVKRAYYVAQLMLLDPQGARQYWPRFQSLMQDLQSAFLNPEILSLLAKALDSAEGKDYYVALSQLRKVMKYEQLVLQKAQPPLSE
ncbi:flagellar biosynthesis repressor FlbT [Telmatospirillum sp. J64-1]|uniref:flagellar biosynthesis repressor FlbT n=1 Tax=Telmatospirillum sp. J64-1 TaxID=2502183 RepID=UPI00115DFEC3|nr:flagellar biosynthesis repressor FlbT [Telmatospirillum sp. J64-1]